ncbi:type II secretion system F family protein [soil metagenome]
MTTFRYTAIRDDGAHISGRMEASSSEAVLAHLTALKHHPIEATALGEGTLAKLSFRRRRPSFNDITLFTREMSWLLQAGLTLSKALDVLADEIRTPRLAPVLARIRSGIRGGQSLHDTLAGLNGVFSPYYINMVEIAEASGTLVPVLQRIAAAREREQATRRKLVSALSYPALLICLAIAAVTFILLTVVPRLKDLIVGSGAPVPAEARRIIALSDWLLANGWSLLVVLAFGLTSLAFALRRAGFRSAIYKLAIKLPFVGSVLRTGLAVQFSRSLATLLAAGVSLPAALSLLRPAFTLPEVRNVIGRMETALRRGEDFVAPLEQSHLFPGLLARMLRVGEETGDFVPGIQHATVIFEEKLEIVIERTLTVLEPLIIVAVSAMIAVIIASIIGAIVSVNDLAI